MWSITISQLRVSKQIDFVRVYIIFFGNNHQLNEMGEALIYVIYSNMSKIQFNQKLKLIIEV